MGFKKIDTGYTVSNPNGELLMYHDVEVTINVGIAFDHDDITSTNEQTVFDLALHGSSTALIPDSVVATFEGINVTKAIADTDVVNYTGDASGHTLQITDFSTTITTPSTNPRHNGSVMGVGGYVVNYSSFRIVGNNLLIEFNSQGERSAAARDIIAQIDGGNTTFGFAINPFVATVVSVTGASTATPQVTLAEGGFTGEVVGFDFDEVISVTHAIEDAKGGAAIPLVVGDELNFTPVIGTSGYVVVDDAPNNVQDL